MARRRNLKSISVPIILGSVTVPLTLALLVGWSVLFGQKIARSHDIAGDVWLLVLGSISFVVIIAVLVLLSIFLAREILEVRRQDSFIDSVTHELKSPLASIKLGLQTMGRGALPADKRELLRTMMLDDVDRLSDFIDDVLQASRLAHDTVGMDMTEVSIASVVTECVTGLASRHQLAEDVIRVEIEPAIRAHTDRAALVVVLRNLLDNAVKYSDDDVHVVVRARANDGEVVIEIQDNGIGIPPKELKRVFQRFYRVPSESVRSRRGTGLGLFVVSALVRNLGGRVDARSEGAGHGTTMRVSLPAHSVARQDESS